MSKSPQPTPRVKTLIKTRHLRADGTTQAEEPELNARARKEKIVLEARRCVRSLALYLVAVPDSLRVLLLLYCIRARKLTETLCPAQSKPSGE